MKWVTAASLILVLALYSGVGAQPPDAISASQINASGCSIVMIGGSNREFSVNPQCNESKKVLELLKSIVAQLNAIKSQQNLSGDKEATFFAGANAWFPILAAQLSQVETDTLAAIAALRVDLEKRFAHDQTAEEITVAFIDLREKKIAGVPLSKCGCEPNYDSFTPEAMFNRNYPDQICLSGLETVEACVIPDKSVCKASSYSATPTWWRVCAK